MSILYKKIKQLPHRIFNDSREEDFIKHNKRVWRANKTVGQCQVLVEFNGLQHCIISWSYFSNFFARKYNARICSYAEKFSVFNRGLQRIYKSFNTEQFIQENLTEEDCEKLNRLFESARQTIQTKKELIDYEILGINIGQDIYEHYLMEMHPTVDFSDERLYVLLKKAIKKCLFWQSYLKHNDVCTIIISHDCYLGNIIRRVANSENIDVFQLTTSFGIKQDTGINCGSNFKYYHNLFMQLNEKKKVEIKSWAKKQLSRRFAGEIGVDMSYSKKSSFGAIKSADVLKHSNRLKVLICSHCFFDNPYCYGKDLLFTDFYEWLCFLGRMSECTDYEWYLKIHPDYRPGTKETLAKILSRFPKIVIVPEDTSHIQLVQEGIKYVFTVYGTVGCEYPLMGVPVINAGNNPHIAYDFCYHPKTVEEYKQLILNLPTLHKEINKEDIYEFYGIHHQYGDYFSINRKMDDMIFQSDEKMREVLKDKVYTSAMYKYFLDEFSEERHMEIMSNVEKYYEKMNAYEDGKLVAEWEDE